MKVKLTSPKYRPLGYDCLITSGKIKNSNFLITIVSTISILYFVELNINFNHQIGGKKTICFANAVPHFMKRLMTRNPLAKSKIAVRQFTTYFVMKLEAFVLVMHYQSSSKLIQRAWIVFIASQEVRNLEIFSFSI